MRTNLREGKKAEDSFAINIFSVFTSSMQMNVKREEGGKREREARGKGNISERNKTIFLFVVEFDSKNEKIGQFLYLSFEVNLIC